MIENKNNFRFFLMKSIQENTELVSFDFSNYLTSIEYAFKLCVF